MNVREWQPRIGAVVYIRVADMTRRAGVGVIQGLGPGPDGTPWAIVELATDYCEHGVDGKILILAPKAQRVAVPSYRLEEVYA